MSIWSPRLPNRMLLASLSVAALLAGCASRSAYDPGEHRGSIKDTHGAGPQMRVAGPVSTSEVPAPKSQRQSVTVASDRTQKPREQAQLEQRTESRALIERIAPDKPVVKDTQPVATEAPPTKPAEVKVAAEPAVKPPVAQAPVTQPAESRPTADLRRNAGPTTITVPATPAPAATTPLATPKPDAQVAAVAPAKTEPSPAQPVTKPSPARPTTPGVSAEPTSKTPTQRTLQLASLWLAQNNMANARAELADAAKGEDPVLLNALAETYDPIMLKRYPRMSGEADVGRAIDLYKQAIAKGFEPAKSALARLQATAPTKQ
jgi:hypothetical protein